MTTATATLIPTGTYEVDRSHSSVEFSVKHLGIATVRGTFSDFEGRLELGEDLASSKAYGTVKVPTIDTKEAQRDEHLRSPDFFDAVNYPELKFESTEIRPLDEETFEIAGRLSMRGVTQDITLKAEIQGTEQDPWGNERVGLEVRGQLDRGDYGMKFNQVLGSGNALVGDKVKILLDISAVKAS